MANKFVPDADAFRFYQDDGSPSESQSAPIIVEGGSITNEIRQDIAGGDKQVHLRYRVQEIGDGDIDGGTTDDYSLQYQVNGGGGWTSITTSSSRVQTDTSSELSDGSATTNRVTNGLSDGSGSFVAGEQEDGDGEITDSQLTGNDFTEHVWALDLISADWSASDFVEFRMRYNGGGMDNTALPRITDDLVRIYDAPKFRFYEDGTESGSSPIAAEDVNLTSRDVSSDSQVHVRWGIQETGGASGNGFLDNWFLFASKNSGTFFQVTTSTSDVKADSASSLIDDANTTNRGVDGISDGTGSFLPGKQVEEGLIQARLLATNFSEYVFSTILIAADLSDGDTIDFQLRSPSNAEGAIINSITPRITVSKGGTVVQDLIMGPGIIPFAR